MILAVAHQGGEILCQGSVDLFEMAAELFDADIGTAVEDDHEFEHARLLQESSWFCA